MRQRVQAGGFEGLEAHEIIEFLLFYAIPRQDVNELAHRLIDHFGNVQGVLSAGIPDLESVPGIGSRTARWLALVGEAAAACGRLSVEDRPLLENGSLALRFAARMEREIESPCCIQLCLDVKGRLLYRRKICDSLSWGEPTTLREALEDVFAAQAHNVILLVCTKEQFFEPQEYDAVHAASYANTLRAADCDLVDVIFMGGGALDSLRRRGWIPPAGEPSFARTLREDYMRDMPEGDLLIQDFRDDE